jgi:hypothetical protein
MNLAVRKLYLSLKVCMAPVSFCSFVVLGEVTADDTITGK